MIDDIALALKKKDTDFTSMGVLNGLGGLSLFHYYYSDYKKEELNEEVFNYLGIALEGLNEEYKGTSIERDILELSRLLSFYKKKGLLSQSDIEVYFESFDPILIELAIDKIKIKEINPIFGAIAYGYYFVMTRSNDSFLNTLIDTIEGLAQKDKLSGGVYWLSDVKREEKRLIELGGNHGIAGVVHFLLELYRSNIQQSRIKSLIDKALIYLEGKEIKGGIGLFAFDSESQRPNETMNLAYGDLSIGNVFYKAGELLHNNSYLTIGKKIIINSSLYRDDDEVNVKDANLLYGSSGITSYFLYYQSKLNSEKIQQAITYWSAKSEGFKRNENEWAGFETHFNRFDVNAPLSLTHGIVGIGICSMQNKIQNKDFEYLHFFNI